MWMFGTNFQRALAIATLLVPGLASAQDYPTRPVTVIVPFAAGGPSDTIARLTSEYMGRSLGQQFVIENVGGAGGTIGAARVARSAPDGYTLLVTHITLPASATLYKNLPYNTADSFEAVGLINMGPYALIARKDYAPNSATELLATLRKDGDKVRMGHAGVGSASHLCTLLLGSAAGFKPTDVPYRGTGPAMQDLVAGNIDVMCDQTTNSLPQIQGKAVKAYAVTSIKRVPQLPALPTLGESGAKSFHMPVRHGIYAPKGTPKAIVDKLNGALQKAVSDPAVIARFEQLSNYPFPPELRSPEAHAPRFKADVAKWREVITAAGVSAAN
jgi:tripartite-type tricarboxylate transporter receptor subunit TctC